MPDTDVLIVGGGASGLAAAAEASLAGEQVTLLEQMDRPGKKLLATGNGRCNLINLNPPVYYGDSEFAMQVLGSDWIVELTRFWHELGVFIRYDEAGRGYPWTNQASTVLDALLSAMKRNRVNVLSGTRVSSVAAFGNGFRVRTESGDVFSCRRLILATGGLAQAKLGGNQDAWPWLRLFGHRMISPLPALVPVVTDKKSISGLQGIRVKCGLILQTDGIPVHAEEGEILFSDHGISGICAMQCARFIKPGHSEFSIDLIRNLFDGEQALIAELNRRRSVFLSEEPPGLLRGICVPRLAFAVCKQAGLPLHGERNRDLTESQVKEVALRLQDYRVQILGTEGFERAQVMAGGLSGEEINPLNMESRLRQGLHVTGELLNVDGDCGGFNLMFAFLSGIRAGRNRRNDT